MRLGMRHGWSWCSRVVAPTAIRLQNDATDSSTSHRHKLPPGARPANEVCHRKYHCNEVRVLIFDRAGRPLYPGDGGALPAGDYPLAGTRRFPAAGPYGPADTSHRRGSPSRGVIGGFTRVRPSPRDGWRPPRSRKAKPLPSGLLLARGHRMERQPLRLLPRASHPRSPAEHAGAETGPSRTDPGTTPSPSAEPPNGASHFTHAPSCRT
jgi:hypothetical protein